MKYTIDCIIPVWNQEELVIKALNSIPEHWRIVVVDDGSTDDTANSVDKWIRENKGRNITFHVSKENRGVGATLNYVYDNLLESDYYVLLGSDDWFTPEITEVEAQINGEDMVFFDLLDNNGSRWALNEKTYIDIPGSVKFVRREFLADTRARGYRRAEDWALMQLLKDKPHTTKFTGIIGKRYNHPRKGSLSDTWHNGREGK